MPRVLTMMRETVVNWTRNQAKATGTEQRPEGRGRDEVRSANLSMSRSRMSLQACVRSFLIHKFIRRTIQAYFQVQNAACMSVIHSQFRNSRLAAW